MADNDFSSGYAVGVSEGRNNSGGMFGDGNWLWIIVVFALLFGWGNGGFGGNRGGQGSAVDGYVLTSDFANVERKIDGVNNGLCNGFYAQAQLVNGVQQSMANGFAQAELSRSNQQAALMHQLYTMGAANQQCCCETQRQMERGFADINYNMATQACDTRNTVQTAARDIIDAQSAGTRAVLDFLTQDKLATLQAENQSLKLAASQATQNNYLAGVMSQETNRIINRVAPYPVPAYQVANPLAGCGCNSVYNGCGCC